jgi:predicted patatin/cPLA2 family phospholipase
MIFEGDRGVISAIKEKKRLMEAGVEHGHIKPLLVIDGGLMKGAYGVGAALAIEELGLTDAFDNVVGISSGAPTAAYFVSGDVSSGSSVIWKYCCSKEFLNMWRFWNQVDTDYFMSALKDSTKYGLQTDKILSARPKLHIGVANFETGKPSLFQPTTESGLFNSIQASILMPNVSNDIVHIDDIRYVDGGFTNPHVLTCVLDQIEVTHMLMITNQNHIDQLIPDLPWLERFLNHTLFRRRMPKLLRFAAHERWRTRTVAIEKIKKNTSIACALVWGNRSIKSMERDADKVQRVVEASRKWWMELLIDETVKDTQNP